jgi:predicted phosphoribosyltransferase
LIFRDRRDAARQVAAKLTEYRGRPDTVVLGLPRGGVVTAHELARSLNLPFDLLIVRKIGVPWQPELAMGAISETGSMSLNDQVIYAYGIPEKVVREEATAQAKEIERRQKLYRHGEGLAPLSGKTVILTDDGIATGATMKAAIMAIKSQKAKKLVVAVPVAPPNAARELKQMADDFVALETPPDFIAVGNYYGDFPQVSDEEVIELIEGGWPPVRLKERT